MVKTKTRNIKNLQKFIKEEKVRFIDIRYCDPKGQEHHMTICSDTFDEDMVEDGIAFDGSSIAGWKTIHKSDMILKPDLDTAYLDPLMDMDYNEDHKTINITCDVVEPDTGEPYNRDPRSTAKKAEIYLQASGVGDTAYFGPEAEFFLFDDVRFSNSQHQCGFFIDAEALPSNDGERSKDIENIGSGNLAHRPRYGGGYAPTAPLDNGCYIRNEMVNYLRKAGIETEKHHHEVGSSQHEIGVKFNTLTKSADELILYKYIVREVARKHNSTATFMPKPIAGDNGNGLHCNQSIWKNNKNIFSGSEYAELSQECLYYIGGILHHAKAISAFTNPTTNSYKRLVPGYEAPTLLAYSSANRSAACRIPYSTSDQAKRIEIRFPDSSANPYLAFTAMLMAGIDGIKNRIHPGEPIDKNMYDLPPEELKEINSISSNLEEAIDALDKDRKFLKEGGVMDDDQINAYIKLKKQEIEKLKLAPHPLEFELYYSC